jgi:diacylglycerol kinase
MIKFKKLIKSFKYALAGLNKAFWEEQNFRIDLLVAAIVLALASWLQIMVWQFMILLIIIAIVLILELLNSILERFVDLLKPSLHAYAKDIKDMTAAAVFIAALTALIIGLLIFLPYLIT